MFSKFIDYKESAVKLRKEGLIYSEIQKKLGVKIPKSTLSTWFKKIKLSSGSQKKLDNSISLKLKKSHETALATIRNNRKIYFNNLEKRLAYLSKYLESIDIAKIVLAVLYLGEGSKGKGRAFMLGNSDPEIIGLFLKFLRKCYKIDEKKFRCTLQCRADQDILKLEKFWSNITDIPLSQFYKARVDPRTIGKKSRKLEYKGVCRIDYFSADVYNEIMQIIKIICKAGH